MPPRPELGPKPRLGYTQSPIERAAELRADDAALTRLTAQPAAGAYVIGGDWIVMKKAAPLSAPLFTLADARALGADGRNGISRPARWRGPFRLSASRRQQPKRSRATSDYLVTDLRSIAVQGLVEPAHLPPIAEAKAVLHWHRATASARIAARRRKSRKPAGSAIARPARPSISRAPTRW